jgi:tetratricopeptide (TPR) repeat protein
MTLPTPAWSQSEATALDSWPVLVEAVESAVSAGDGDRLAQLSSQLTGIELAPRPWRKYWVAYAAYRQGLFSDDEALAEAAYQRCIDATEAAISLGEQSGESEALRGACFSQLAAGGPQAGMRYGNRSAVAIDTALTDAPGNPRALMVGAARDLYTPIQWGGDIERAVRRLERALEGFASEDDSGGTDPWQPRWGRVDALGHLAIAYGRLGRSDQALGLLDQAGADGIRSAWLDDIRRRFSD